MLQDKNGLLPQKTLLTTKPALLRGKQSFVLFDTPAETQEKLLATACPEGKTQSFQLNFRGSLWQPEETPLRFSCLPSGGSGWLRARFADSLRNSVTRPKPLRLALPDVAPNTLGLQELLNLSFCASWELLSRNPRQLSSGNCALCFSRPRNKKRTSEERGLA